MKKRTIAVISALFLLSACSGSESKCKDNIWTGDIGICISDGWEQVSDAKLQEEGVPEETIAAFQMTEKRAGQRDNIVISREGLPTSASALAYSEANMKIIEATPQYTVIEKREVEIDGNETILHIFSARPIADLPARRFYQLHLTKRTTGYVFTGTLPFSVEDFIEDGLIDMLLSASLQEK
jgi:hypothetical protein